MIRTLFLTLSFAFLFTTSGLAQGEVSYISWQKQPNGIEVFYYNTLAIGTAVPSTVSISSDHPAYANITASLDSTFSSVSNCGATSGFFLVRYKSGVLPITSPFPNNKVTFEISTGLTGFSNLTGSGSFCQTTIYDVPQLGDGWLNNHTVSFVQGQSVKGIDVFEGSSENGDSSYFSFSNFPTSINSATAPTYSPGYSGAFPLPTGCSISNKGDVTVSSSIVGKFGYLRKVELFNGPAKTGEIYAFDFVEISSSSNNPPSVSVTPSGSGVMSPDTATYLFNTLPGDSVKFRITGQDFDLNPGFTPQNITFDFSGIPNGFMGYVSAQPVSPQTGFTNAQDNSVDVKIKVPKSLTQKAGISFHRINITMTDNACPNKFVAPVTILLRVNQPFDIPDTVFACAGDSAIIEINPSATIPSLNPTPDKIVGNKAFYFLSTTTSVVANASGYSDTCIIKVDQPIKPVLVNQNGLQISNFGSYDAVNYYLNGQVVAKNTASFMTTLSGDYFVEGIKGGCNTFSDTILVQNTFNTSLFANGPVQTTQPGVKSFGLLFQPLGGINGKISISEITLYGIPYSDTISLGQSSLNIKDLSGSNFFTTDSIIVNEGLVVAYGSGELNVGGDYILYVETDPSFVLNRFQPIGFPFSDIKNSFRVNGGLTSQTGGLPASKSGLVPFFALTTNVHLLLQEQDLGLLVYPNPAQAELNISFTNQTSGSAVLYDIAGKVIANQAFYNQNAIKVFRPNNFTGAAFLKVVTPQGVRVEKVIFQ